MIDNKTNYQVLSAGVSNRSTAYQQTWQFNIKVKLLPKEYLKKVYQ